MRNNNFGLYIHIPFCEVVCGYCDFCTIGVGNSKTAETKTEQFVEVLLKEFEQKSNFVKTFVGEKNPADLAELSSIFFGGGTPSLLNPEQFRKIFSKIKEFWKIKDNAEITVEANPDSLSLELLVELKKLGVNRISLGVQSFDQEVLKTLQRTHSQENVEQVVKNLNELRISYSFDLIYGTPGESINSWASSIKEAIMLNPNHISCYALTLERDVRLQKLIDQNKLADVDEDDQAKKYELADALLTESGFKWYEISNWAKSKESESIHNLNYWKNGNWLGLGPSAHSHLIAKTEIRFWNKDDVDSYLKDGVEIEQEVIDKDARILEDAILRARLNQEVVNKTEEPELYSTLLQNGLILKNSKPSLKGRMLNDVIIRRIVENKENEDFEVSRSQATFKQTVCQHFNKTTCRSCPQCVVE